MPGFLVQHCRWCGERIYLKQDRSGKWTAFEAWVTGRVEEGEWVRHSCSQNRDPKDGPPEGAPKATAEGPMAPSPTTYSQPEGSTSVHFIDRFMLTGMSLPEAMDVLAKMAYVLDKMAVHGLNPTEEMGEYESWKHDQEYWAATIGAEGEAFEGPLPTSVTDDDDDDTGDEDEDDSGP
jgi:hypothetical protein